MPDNSPLFVVTTLPGPEVQFVELEAADGSLADARVPYEVYPGKPTYWRLGPLFRAPSPECKCDPPGGGEEFCTGHCVLRARIADLECQLNGLMAVLSCEKHQFPMTYAEFMAAGGGECSMCLFSLRAETLQRLRDYEQGVPYTQALAMYHQALGERDTAIRERDQNQQAMLMQQQHRFEAETKLAARDAAHAEVRP